MSEEQQTQEWMKRSNLFESTLIMMGRSDLVTKLKKVLNENREISVNELQSLINQTRK